MFAYVYVPSWDIPSESRDLAHRALRSAEAYLDLPRDSRMVRWFELSRSGGRWADFHDPKLLGGFTDLRDDPPAVYVNAAKRGADIVRIVGHEAMHSKDIELGLFRPGKEDGRRERAAREWSAEFVDLFYPLGSRERFAELDRIRAGRAEDEEACRGFFGTDDWLDWLTAQTPIGTAPTSERVASSAKPPPMAPTGTRSQTVSLTDW
jgi:hypothetical protein